MTIACAGLIPTSLAADPLCPGFETGQTLTPAELDSDTIDASADMVRSEDGTVLLRGSSVITFQGQQIRADDARYDSNTGEVQVEGELSYSTPEFRLDSNDATVDLNSNSFRSGKSTYLLTLDGRIAQGRASRLVRDEKTRIKLWDATYSACPPGEEAWNIKASKIRLDPEEGIGTAKNIALRFKGVPILYAPVFSFPINNKRKTGFLAPSFRQAENTGFEIMIPWYWNISPNLDATLTPRYMTQWGTQFQGEFRYKNRIGDWKLNTEYLYDNDADMARRFTRFRHQGTLASRWSSLIDASFVTDKDYFQDFGDSLNIASITHLDRRGEIRYRDNINDFLIRIQRYQTVDSEIPAEKRPYLRLPQISWNATLPRSRHGFKAGMSSELVYFDRNDSVTGSRVDLHPSLSLPLSSDSWFLTPTAGLRYTNYQLQNVELSEIDAVTDSNITRSLPYGSIDGGLFFDRHTDNKGSVQTLEPRMYYLRVPYEKQSDIPVFDSGELDFNFSQLFRENRFSGNDRVADANQLTTAVTTRFIDGPSGREQLRASIGQIVYFDDRRVFLEEEKTERRSSSDLVGEISAELKSNWVVKSNMQYNPYNSTTVRSSVQFSYQPASDRVFNMAHRRILGKTEQIDFSAFWPLNDNWKASGRWNFSLDSRTSIETTLGLEYESCCWAFRFAARRYISDDGLDHEINYFLELILKGLAPVGDNVGALLESGVLGYSDNYR
ncbi:MAG: LPS-assembly protein LptD [Gammaproteobacteria bacterium]|nr:LPS-assembly protein LptD [Gammaproteobacteria bacterium]